MLFQHLIDATSDRPIDDWLELSWPQCIRRAARHQTRNGKTVRILLPVNRVLRHGSRITNGEIILAVDLKPCEVLIIRPANARVAAQVGLGLGNLHAPVQVLGDELLTLPDGPAEQILGQLNVTFSRALRRFEPDLCVLPNLRLSADFAIQNS